MLFKNTQEIQEFFPIEKNTSFAMLKPFIQQAEDDYIIRVLGSEQHTALEEAYNGTPPMDEDDEKLLKKVREALVPLMLYLAAPNINIRWSDIGLMKTESNDFSPASGAEVYFARVQLLLRGYSALDALYRFLEENEDDYEEWTESESYSIHEQYLLNTAAAFNRHVDIADSRWLFARLLPYMESVELLRIRPALGDFFYAEIVDEVREGGYTDDKEKHVVNLLSKAIALFTYGEALHDPVMRDTIRIVNAKTADDLSNKGFAAEKTFEQFDRLAERKITEGDAIMSQLIKYLNTHADDNLFTTWRDSSKYQNPSTQMDNASDYHNDTSDSTFCMI